MSGETSQTGPLVVNVEGTELRGEEVSLLTASGVGGLLLFAKNFESRRQLCRLVTDIRSVRKELLLMVDQEGGRVQRFQEEFTRLPPFACYGEFFAEDPDSALQLVRDIGWVAASELLACGVDLNLAPVLDLNLGLNSVIGNRSFGSDPEMVVVLARAWFEGVHEAGMACVGKHFPGHGSVAGDSHLTLPNCSLSMETLEQRDMVPFERMIAYGIDALMPAHIVYTEMDSRPCGFSDFWLKDLLRGRLGFRGVIVSDCMTMKGAASAGGYADRVEKSLAAGCDLVIVSSQSGAREALERLQEKKSLPAASVGRLKGRANLQWQELRSTDRYRNVTEQLARLGW